MENKKQMTGYTDTVFMIEPVAFDYNPETAVNNLFQKTADKQSTETQKLALAEFNNMVNLLKNEGVKVITIKDTPQPHKPDSIFPNNWVSFHENNQVVLYPMFAENRRVERRMDILEEIEKQLDRKFKITDYSDCEAKNIFLEGTGSYVPDRKNKIAYASISQRTHEVLFKKFCEENNFKPVIYNASQKVNGEFHPIYHTNVIMCEAAKHTIICLEVIRDEQERKMVVSEIEKSGKKVFEISEHQMNNFAGNMLLVKNKSEELILVMSKSAFDSLTKEQISELESNYKLLVCPIPTIEKYGGGSARCMIAEIF